jgi:orotate phosphoribosyltransferase
MNRIELAQEIYRTASIKGTFRLRSGQISTEYFDKYLFESNPRLLASIATEMMRLIPGKTEYLAGLELGGIPIATMLSHVIKIPTLYIRQKAKEYGTCNLIEGGPVEGKHVLIIEDIVTSAGAIVEGVHHLREAKAIVNCALCVVDRESGGAERLKELQVELKSLFRRSELNAAGK